MEEGKEECHEKVVASLVDVPQEVCDLNPVKTCRFATKLVPHLSPTHQCTIVPREVCVLKYSTPRQVTKPLISKWCLDTSEDPTASQSSEESKAVGEAGPSGPNTSTGSSAADLETYSSQSPQTSVEALEALETVEADSNYGSPTEADLDDLSQDDLDSSSVSVELSQEQSYVSPPESTRPSVEAEKSEDSLDDYGSSTQNIDESYSAEDSYIVPSAPSLAVESHGVPPQESNEIPIQVDESYVIPTPVDESYGIPTPVDESYGIPSQVDESYVIPSPVDESYVIPSQVEESYVIPSPVEESYVIPPQVDVIPTETSMLESDISDVSPINTFYEVPSYEYEDDLDSYKSNEIPSYQPNPESFPSLSEYKIDSGYGQESLFSYAGAADDRSDSPSLSRRLLPPASELIKTNNIKSKPNRIRSVDPYYYKI